MALVRCVDCNKEISDQAPTCPSCGRPQYTASSLPVVGVSTEFGENSTLSILYLI